MKSTGILLGARRSKFPNDLNSKIIIGIDPGLTGGFSVFLGKELIRSEVLKRKEDCLDASWLAKQLCDWNPSHIILEKVHAMPGQGVSSMFKFGQVFGTIKSVIDILEFDYDEVPNQAWPRYFFGNTRNKEIKNKDRNIDFACKLWPDFDFTATEKSKKPHTGKVDSALIGYYGVCKRTGL